MRAKRWYNVIVVLLCAVLAGLSYAQEASKPKPVEVATPQRGTIDRTTVYTGNLEADAVVAVYANASGKLVRLKVNEGAHVAKGDVLAETDSREQRLALTQAEAALQAAESQLAKTEATARIKIESQAENARALHDAAVAQSDQAHALAERQVASAFEQAEAGVLIAEAGLQKAEKGARTQEVQQAKAVVAGAKATFDNAHANFERVQMLHDHDAVSDKDFDTAKAQRDAGKSQHAGAVEQLSLVEEGPRSEDIRIARAQLNQAAASFEIARTALVSKDWEKQIALAASQVRQAESNLKSAETMVKTRAWEHDISAARAQAAQAGAGVALAKKRLLDTKIEAPIDGIVAKRDASLGEYATAAGSPAASPIFTIVKMDVVNAVFEIPASELDNAAVGADVTISARGRQLGGKIHFVSPIVNPEGRTVQVKAEIQNPTYKLKPGMFVEVSIDISPLDELLLLPREAVLGIRGGEGHVFVADGGKAQQQTVKVGLVWGDNIAILEGVTDTTPVIVSGHRQLADGVAVRVVK